jgi:hypothetical protein
VHVGWQRLPEAPAPWLGFGVDEFEPLHEVAGAYERLGHPTTIIARRGVGALRG